MRLAVPLLLALAIAAPAAAATHRDRSQVQAFKREHPCPATGRASGPCRGYVVDHVHPLCAGGADRPTNMQWQTADSAKVKDRWERSICRR